MSGDQLAPASVPVAGRDPAPARAAGLLLAAGEGRRLGAPKGLVRGPDGVPWVAGRSAALAAGGCAPVVVVLGAAADDVRPLLPAGTTSVVAADWSQGMGASLRAGLRALAALEPQPEACVVALVDTPGLTPTAVRRLVAAAGPSSLAQAAYGGRRGHPVVLGREHWAGVSQVAHGDRGARDYLRERDVRLVECGDVADGADVDTGEDAARHGATW
ncbi:nucleotidyltransferase family protein [Thalassiella azotivora]